MPGPSGAVELAIVLKSGGRMTSELMLLCSRVMQGASSSSHFRPRLCLHLNFVVALRCRST